MEKLEKKIKKLKIIRLILIILLLVLLVTTILIDKNNNEIRIADYYFENEKFIIYHGQHRRGSEVNAMLNTVLDANAKAKKSGEDNKLVQVTGAVSLDIDATNITSQADTSKLYTIVVHEYEIGIHASTYVNTITVTEE